MNPTYVELATIYSSEREELEGIKIIYILRSCVDEDSPSEHKLIVGDRDTGWKSINHDIISIENVHAHYDDFTSDYTVHYYEDISDLEIPF